MIHVAEYNFALGTVNRRDAVYGRLLVPAVLLIIIAIIFPFIKPFSQGLYVLSLDTFFSEPRSGGAKGGIAPIILSTFYVISLACSVAIPISLLIAAYLSEFGGERGRVLFFYERLLELLAAIPSIVYGLAGNALFCVALGLGYSILSGALTLALMIAPFLIKSFYETILQSSLKYRTQSEALGLSKFRLVFSILLPASFPALTIGVVLGLGRAFAETAALLFTSGYSMRYPESVLDSGRVLSVHIYDLSMNVAGGEQMAFFSAAVLMTIILLTGISVACLRLLWRRNSQ